MTGLRRFDIDTIEIKFGDLHIIEEPLEDESTYSYFGDRVEDDYDDDDGAIYHEYKSVKNEHHSNSKATDVIRNCLLSIKSSNFFSCGGSILDAPSPDLYIDEIGNIALPIGEEQAKHIINKSNMAPFGMGEKTVFDTNIRHTWQMDPSQFTINNSRWDKVISYLADHVGKKLGCNFNVKHSLYKLLIYEPGSFFKTHCDTEKEQGMFSTLIVVLPSAYSGGQLVVRQSGREYEYDFENMKGGLGTNFAGFYADCEHEIKPITAGYRVCLVYNLASNSAICNIPSKIKDHAALLKQIIENIKHWIINIDTCPALLLYGLEHKYTYDGLSFNSLKGRDIIIAQVLKEVSESVPLDVASVSMRRGRLECSYEEEERTTIIECVSGTGDLLPQLKNILIHHEDMIQAQFWKDKTVGREGCVPTGNEGVTPTLFYYHSGIIFSPKQIRHHKYLRRNWITSVEYLNTLKEESDLREVISILARTTEYCSGYFSPDAISDFFSIITQRDCGDQVKDIFDVVKKHAYMGIHKYIELALKLHRKSPAISINPAFRMLVGYIIGELEKDPKGYAFSPDAIIKFRKLQDTDFA